MTLNEVESSETMFAKTNAERSLETLSDVRREAQRMYTSQFQSAVDRGEALSPQQMRVGIALLNVIRTTILDEARIERKSAKPKTRGRSSGNGQALSATPSATPESSESGAVREQTAAVEGDFDSGVDENQPWAANESPLTEKPSEEPSGDEFEEHPVLILGETRRIVMNAHFVPAPSEGDSSYIRPGSPGASG